MEKNTLFISLILILLFSCKEDNKITITNAENYNYKNLFNGNSLKPLKNGVFIENKNNLFPTSAFFDGGSKYEDYVNENGIPLHTIDNIKYFHPSQIAAYGLDLYFDFYKTNDTLFLKKFLKQAKWLSENIKKDDKFSTWEIPFDNKSFLIDAPYPSALTNSWGAGVLFLASQFENKEIYLKQSKSALNYMLTDIKEGGGLSYYNNTIWFEEYPSIANPSHVLNGYIFSIDILHLFYEVTNENIYLEFLNKAFTSLEKNLKNYNKEYGSIYDQFLKGNKIGNGYHKLHWIQLLWASKMSGNKFFLITAKQFLEQERQNNYKLQSNNCIDCIKHGVEVLNNNKYWYGSWSANDKLINLNIDFNLKKDVYQFNFYSLNEKNFPDSIMICGDIDRQCITYNINKLEFIGYNKHKKNITFVKSLFLSKVLKTKKLTITFFNPSRKIIALRNFGIQFLDVDDLTNQYQKLNKKNFWDNRHVLQIKN